MFGRLRRLFAIAAWAEREGVPASEATAAFERQRRQVLQGLAATAALSALPAFASGCDGEEGSSGGAGGGGGAPKAKVAVIGAGIAGLHCAYRLSKAGVDVTLYEAQERVGGRMWTGRGILPGNLLFEIGGELIDSNHATMLALADELGITLDDRWAAEPAGMTRETWFVSGARVTNETLLQQTVAISASLTSQVEAAESDDAAFEALDATPLSAWLDEHVPVATAAELHEVLRVAFVGEFGLEPEEQSALNLLYLFGFDRADEFLIFGDSDERWHTHDGNDTFTTKLAEGLQPGQLRQGLVLTRAAGPAEGPYELTFEAAAAGGEGLTVQADHVVFALPFTLLRRVDLTGLALSEEKRQIIAELGYGTNAKVMGHFTSRPWWDVHAESGLLTTDLGAQQGWDSTIGQTDVTGGVWTNFLGGAQGVASGEGTPAEWFGGIADQLETVWPGSRAAFSGQAERMHWPSFPWSRGSYTCYRPGQWAFWSLEGVREGNVHFCGEHTSIDFQGWMEGAAETGGLAAVEVLADLGLAPQGLRARPSRVRWQSRAKRLRGRRS